MKNRVLALFLVVCLIALSFVGCSNNKDSQTGNANEYEYLNRDLPEAEYITAAETFAGGDGTKENPYQISNAQELALLAKEISNIDYSGAHYVLTNDIELNNTENFNNWETSSPKYSWMPIGFGDSASIFKGVFDGLNHTVRGMYINANAENSTDNYGLFSKVSGSVKNVNIDKSYIAVSGKSSKVGSVAGEVCADGKIINCSSDAFINTYENVCGGIVGSIDDNTVIGQEQNGEKDIAVVENCTFTGKIKQVKDKSLSYIGGIAGASAGYIKNCVNNSVIDFKSDSVDLVGGIVAMADNNIITDCINKGTINCEFVGKESASARAGGIVGLAQLTSTGSEKYMSRGLVVDKCVNEGKIINEYYAGGIISNARNDNNDYSLTISNCVNKGEVVSESYAGGIFGYLESIGDNETGESIIVKNCDNKSNLSGDTVGGIAGGFKTETGDITIENCKNDADLVSSGQQCAGIIGFWLMDSEPKDSNVTIRNCDNSGNIKSNLSAGGIISFMDMSVELKKADSVKITVDGCDNSGNVTSSQVNGAVGGIIGVLGMRKIKTTVENCTNSGLLEITAVLSEDEADEKADKVMTISRVIGGIIGRVGKGLMLTIDNDDSKDYYINKNNAYCNVKNCSNTGIGKLADDRSGVNLKNFLGGIVGYVAGEKDYSVSVDNCSYQNFEGEYGNADF